MAKILPLIIYPDPLLKETSEPVTKVDDKLRAFMDDMLKTMYDEGGIGLAAVQVGRLERILVMDIEYEAPDCCGHHDHHHDHEITDGKPLFLVNPEILEASSELQSYNEGCLSFPTARAEVSRPKSVKVKYLDYHGKEKIEEMDGILAICVQHEMDHLNGITFVDHLSRTKREMVIKKMLKNMR